MPGAPERYIHFIANSIGARWNAIWPDDYGYTKPWKWEVKSGRWEKRLAPGNPDSVCCSGKDAARGRVLAGEYCACDVDRAGRGKLHVLGAVREGI